MTDQFDNIPSELKELRQWLCWKSENGAKVPKVASGRCNRNASSTDRKTWRSFEEAVSCARKNKSLGVGFVFTKHDPFIGIDLDNKSNDPELEKDFQFWINRFDSYVERSPSGTGYHILIRGENIRGFNAQPFEAYSDGRYFTFTGDVVLDRSINGKVSAKSDFFKIFGESDHSQFEMPKAIEVGNRNDTMFRLACSMHSRGMNSEDVATLIIGYNRGLGNPLPTKEVNALLKSAASYDQENEKRHTTSSDESPLQVLTKLSATQRISDMKKNLSNDFYIIPEMALGGQLTLFYAKPNTGKTLLFFHFLIQGIKDGTLNAADILCKCR